MILNAISLEGYGPFADRIDVLIEPDLTVLTGPNDAGKSWVLRGLAKAIEGVL